MMVLPVILPYWPSNDPKAWNTVENSLFMTFWISCFVLGMSLIIFPCIIGYNDFLLKILGAPFWTPFARITYGAYLVHPTIMFYYVF